MEAAAVLEMVKGMFNHTEVKAYVLRMVIDDDASMRALLCHSLSELERSIIDYEWPVDKKGKKVPKSKDKEQLPLDHPVILFLANVMHRIRTFGKYVFGLSNALMSISTMTMVDTYRLKRNFGYWLLSCCQLDFDVFAAKAKAVVEHHFNNHEHCGD